MPDEQSSVFSNEFAIVYLEIDVASTSSQTGMVATQKKLILADYDNHVETIDDAGGGKNFRVANWGRNWLNVWSI